MKEKIKIYIILVLIMGGLIGGLIVWQNQQKIERKYQACLDKCRAEFNYFGVELSQKLHVCQAECREKYGK